MRPLWEGHGFRRASYWVLIAAFLTLSIYAGEQAFGLQQTLDDKEGSARNASCRRSCRSGNARRSNV